MRYEVVIVFKKLKEKIKTKWARFRLWLLERRLRKTKPFFERVRDKLGREWWKIVRMQHGLEEYVEEEE